MAWQAIVSGRGALRIGDEELVKIRSVLIRFSRKLQLKAEGKNTREKSFPMKRRKRKDLYTSTAHSHGLREFADLEEILRKTWARRRKFCSRFDEIFACVSFDFDNPPALKICQIFLHFRFLARMFTR